MRQAGKVAALLGLSAAQVFAADAVIPGARWWSHILYLASDSLEGRETGSPGHRKAAKYVAKIFREAGLKPAGNDGYFQSVSLTSRKIREDRSSVALLREGRVEKLELGEDAILSLRTDSPGDVEAPLVFVGYGLSVPEANVDDLAGFDLSGKVVVYLSGGPAVLPSALRAHAQSTAERWKALKRAGAVGAIRISDPRHMESPWKRYADARFRPAMTLSDPSLSETSGQKIAMTVNPEHAEKFFSGASHTFAEIVSLAAQEKPLPRFPMNATVRAHLSFESSPVVSQNVAGILPGNDPKLRNQVVVLSAHLDHLGIGTPVNGDSIYNGAMDNASGVATLLDLAQSLHESRTTGRRSILFVAVTAEEHGLLGSEYFAARPTVAADSIVADINIDMFLPLRRLKLLTVFGLDESDLGDVLREVATPLGIALQGDPEPERNVFIRSDQYSFVRRGVPAINFDFGVVVGTLEAQEQRAWLRDHYHAPSDDTTQPVDVEAAAAYNSVTLKLVVAVANRDERPLWKETSFFRRFARHGN